MKMPEVICGDCLVEMAKMSENSIDAIVTDPPYGLKFMGKGWDNLNEHKSPSAKGIYPKNRNVSGYRYSECEGYSMQEWHHNWAESALRVAKPGAHMLAFGGTRTHHRLMVAIEDAGWEIRDTLGWTYGSGFPKSFDVSKAIEAKTITGSSNKTQFKNLEGEKGITSLGYSKTHAENDRPNNYNNQEYNKKVNLTTDAAKQWNGWGTALKPAWEPIILSRKPLEGTIAENVLKWGTGGINIDACRVPTSKEEYQKLNNGRQSNRTIRAGEVVKGYGMKPEGLRLTTQSTLGRFPANLIHDGSDEVLAEFPKEKQTTCKLCNGDGCDECDGVGYTGVGTAARFFYCAKASRSERDFGLTEILGRKTPMAGRGQGGLKCKICGKWKVSGSPCTCPNPDWEPSKFESPQQKNSHPTVKPIALMRYLCRLITPPNGMILDPFGGSGSTGIAAIKEGFNSILIEIEQESVDTARLRIAGATKP